MPRSIAARHTVGLADPLDDDRDEGGGMEARVDAGSEGGAAGTAEATPSARGATRLPRTLAGVIARHGQRHFKLKLCGDPAADLERLRAIARILDALPSYAVTLDGNEQFPDVAAIAALDHALAGDPALGRLAGAVLYLEQPLARDVTLVHDVSALARARPLLIDEADATLDAFPRARALGYAGVSSKHCKGLYKSLLNAARCARWNAASSGPRAFVSGEDLTCQAGLAVQQDLALAALLGVVHVERNGHHYVDGFAGQGAGVAEREAFLAGQPGLYAADGDNVRLRIEDGVIDLRSLDAPGFASRAWPDFESMTPLAASAVVTLT